MKENMTSFFLEQIDKVNNNGYTYIEIQDPDFFETLVDFKYFEDVGFKIERTSDMIKIDWSHWEDGNV